MHINKIRKYYFISKFDTNHIDKQDKNTIIIYRNYDLKNHLRTIIKLKKYCIKKNLKFFLSNDVKLAINLNLDGVYIPSFNKSFGHLSYSHNNKFKIIGSAHNLKEIKTKEMQKVSKIILSSLFKKNKNFLGLFRFKLLSRLTKKNVVALGGISRKNLKMLKILDNQEFAGISYFE